MPFFYFVYTLNLIALISKSDGRWTLPKVQGATNWIAPVSLNFYGLGMDVPLFPSIGVLDAVTLILEAAAIRAAQISPSATFTSVLAKPGRWGRIYDDRAAIIIIVIVITAGVGGIHDNDVNDGDVYCHNDNRVSIRCGCAFDADGIPHFDREQDWVIGINLDVDVHDSDNIDVDGLNRPFDHNNDRLVDIIFSNVVTGGIGVGDGCIEVIGGNSG
jgi:hypothetical protein